MISTSASRPSFSAIAQVFVLSNHISGVSTTKRWRAAHRLAECHHGRRSRMRIVVGTLPIRACRPASGYVRPSPKGQPLGAAGVSWPSGQRGVKTGIVIPCARYACPSVSPVPRRSPSIRPATP
jgi:hypothetical protein